MSAKVVTKPAAKASDKEGVILDRGYTPYTGSYLPQSGNWAVIARQMLKTTARQPWVIVMLVLVALPTVVCGGLLYLATKMTGNIEGAKAAMDPDRLVMLPWGTTTLAFFLALFAGGGQVADDARAGAFQFYFSRPVSRDQYLIGKLVPVIGLTLVASLVPSLLLSLLRLALLPTSGEIVQHVRLVGATLLVGIIEALALAVPAVAASSLSKRRGYVQGLFATLYLLPWLVGRIFVSVTRSPWPTLPSVPAHLENIARVLYHLPPLDDEPALPVWISFAFVGVLVAASLWLLRRQLAAVEVVAS